MKEKIILKKAEKKKKKNTRDKWKTNKMMDLSLTISRISLCSNLKPMISNQIKMQNPTIHCPQ